jgi:hypothetical protein
MQHDSFPVLRYTSAIRGYGDDCIGERPMAIYIHIYAETPLREAALRSTLPVCPTYACYGGRLDDYDNIPML